MKFWNEKPWRDERSRMNKPYIPKGCDQQGRTPEAAEAATDLGVDEPPPPDMLKVVLGGLAIAAALVAVVAVVVLVAVGRWG